MPLSLLVASLFALPVSDDQAAGAQPRAAQSPDGSSSAIGFESSPQLFATLCALDAAGFDAEASTLEELPARAALRQELLQLQGPSVDALRQFYHDHELADSGETLSRYISFALVTGPPPKFAYLLDHDLLPPDVLALEGFQEALGNFYREARLDERWARVASEYAGEMRRAEGPIRQTMLLASAYLREIVQPSGGRTFKVFIEPLVGSRTNFRNYGDHYSIAVGGARNLPLDDIRHAYLHFLLDRLPLRYREVVEAKAALLNVAARAPRLPLEYQKDFVALTDECLVKAVELRLRRLPPARLEAGLQEEDLTGYILVRPLVAQLKVFEKSEPSMSLYFRDLIGAIDVASEQKRLENFAFAPVEERAAKPEVAAGSAPASDLESLLAEADEKIALQDASAAKAKFSRILAKYPGQPRAIYGLAIASVLAKDAENAKKLFEQLVTSATAPGGEKEGLADPVEPTILAWSHVYLGRIHDLEGERELAVSEYRAAMDVDGAPEAARVAAQRGTETAYKPTSSRSNEEQKP